MKKIKWDKINFPNSIDAMHLFHQKINVQDFQHNLESSVIMTAMFNSQNFLCLGNN
jgi:hypothetical protein